MLSAADATVAGKGSSAAGALTISGDVGTSGTIKLSAGNGGIAINAAVNSTVSVELASTGSVTEPAGSVTTPLLKGSVDGELHLAGHSNQINALGNLTVNGGKFTLVDGVALTVSGRSR